MKRIVPVWMLFGAFAGSAALNVYHARSASVEETGSTLENADPEGVEAKAADPIPCRRCRPAGAPCRSGRPLVDTLELTAIQKNEFAQCCPTYAQKRVQLHERINSLGADLERELSAEKPDMERVGRLADEIGALHAEELKCRVNSILLVRKTLTPTQLERLCEHCGQK